MRQQPALVPSSVHLLEQIPKKGVQQLCATTRLLPGMKLEAERFSPTPVTLLVMGTGHERSYSSFIWKRNVRSQLAYTSSLLATVQLKEHSAVFIFCIYTLQTIDFQLFPAPKRRAFQQPPISSTERCTQIH